MQVKFIRDLQAEKVDARVLFIYKDYVSELIPEELKAELEVLKERQTYDIEKGGVRKFVVDGSPFYICSLGVDAEKAVTDDLRFCAYKLFCEVKKERYTSISIMVQAGGLSKPFAYSILAEMAANSEYSFDRFKSNKKDCVFAEMNIADSSANVALEAAVSEGLIKGDAIKTARFLVDEPANLLTPQDLAKRSQELGKKYGFSVDVYEKDKIEKLGMKAYLAVSQGSNNPPKLIVMRYKGADKNSKTYGLVGKGLCFDSGGYSLKPSDGMKTMKIDMGGAATVIGAMQAIAAAKLKVNVIAVVAACQNLIGPDAYFPGDIIGSMGGKSIYVGNTDAEGRLTLIDAITYIRQEEKVDTVFDFATLTGAAMRAMGNAAAATLSNDDDLYADYEKAAKLAGEKAWRMPIFPEYKKLIEHKEADLTNSAGNPGMITAGMFLGEFVGETPWVHVDIAPVAQQEKQVGFYDAGATGYGVTTVYEFAKSKE